MSSQLEINRMWVKASLFGQIGLPVFPDIMIDQHNRHEERDKPGSVLIKNIQEFLFFIGRDVILKISHEMVERVGTASPPFTTRTC
jgi:hypothetical protein